MKPYVLLIYLFTMIIPKTKAAEYADGYILTLANDTIHCKIKLDKPANNHFELYNRVDITDTFGNKIIYRAGQKEINGFGFIYNNKPVVYRWFDEGPYNVFECSEETGSRLNLYYYDEFSYRNTLRVFSLENKSGERQKIRYNVLSNWKGKVLKFLKDDPTLQKLADETIHEFDDIKTFVIKANTQG